MVFLMAKSELYFKYKRGKLVVHTNIKIEDDNYMIHIHNCIGE